MKLVITEQSREEMRSIVESQKMANPVICLDFVSLGCYGCRGATHIADDECLVGIPNNKLADNQIF